MGAVIAPLSKLRGAQRECAIPRALRMTRKMATDLTIPIDPIGPHQSNWRASPPSFAQYKHTHTHTKERNPSHNPSPPPPSNSKTDPRGGAKRQGPASKGKMRTGCEGVTKGCTWWLSSFKVPVLAFMDSTVDSSSTLLTVRGLTATRVSEHSRPWHTTTWVARRGSCVRREHW